MQQQVIQKTNLQCKDYNKHVQFLTTLNASISNTKNEFIVYKL